MRKSSRSSQYYKKDNRKKAVLFVAGLLFLMLILDAWRTGKILLNGMPVGTQETPSKTKEKSKKSQKMQADGQKVRVLLKTTGFSSLFHERVTITCAKAFGYTSGNQMVSCSAGQKVTFTNKMKQERVVFHSEKGRLQVLSIVRQNRNPKYRGSLTIRKESQGLTLMNQVTLGQYLYAVVPSEMSSGNEMEALKAQAICARNYCLMQLEGKPYQKYGADLDDSTSYQVYNNIPEDSRSRRAVQGTGGQVLYYQKELAKVYYYSTNWGTTAGAKEVWGDSDAAVYLKGKREMDLSEEQTFRTYLQETHTQDYDRNSEWYRWRVTVPLAILEQKTNVGRVTSVTVTKREKCGLVSALKVLGTDGEKTIHGQQTIRSFLFYSGCAIQLQNGNQVNSLATLPSTAFYVDGNKKTVTLHGGGFGHGVGMSQSGACQMAQEGKKTSEILQYYFPSCELSSGRQ